MEGNQYVWADVDRHFVVVHFDIFIFQGVFAIPSTPQRAGRDDSEPRPTESDKPPEGEWALGWGAKER